MKHTGVGPQARSAGRKIEVHTYPVAPSPVYPTNGDPLHVLYTEFRWQRRMMMGLLVLLLFCIPAMMWYMQTTSAHTAYTAAQTTQSAAATTTQPTMSSDSSTMATTTPLSTQSTTNTTTTTTPATVSCADGDCLSLQSTLGVTETGNINVSGSISAGRFIGDGSSLTSVDATTLAGQSLNYFTDASHLTSGMISPALISDALATLGITANGGGTTGTAGSSLTTPVTVANGGTGASFLTPNSLLVGNGSGPIATLSNGSSGQCLTQTTSGPTFADCPTGTLQSAYDNGSANTPTLISTSSQPTVRFQAGPGLDSDQFLQVNNAAGTTTFAVGSSTGAVTVGGGSSAGQLTIYGASASTPVAMLQAASGQTADLFQAKSSNGTTVARIDALGNAVFTTVTQSSGTANLATLAVSGDMSTLGSVGIGGPSNLAARLQVAAAPAQVGLIVKGGVNQVGDLLQVQNSSGTSIVRVDASGTLIAVTIQVSGNLSFGGHLINSAVVLPTVASVLAGITQPLITGTDTAGTVTVVAGIGVTAGILAHVSFATPYISIPHVVLTATTATSASASVYVVPSLTGFDIVAPSALLGTGLYSYNYIVIQ